MSGIYAGTDAHPKNRAWTIVAGATGFIVRPSYEDAGFRDPTGQFWAFETAAKATEFLLGELTKAAK